MRIWAVLLLGCVYGLPGSVYGQCPTMGYVGNLPSAESSSEDGFTAVVWDPDGAGAAPEVLVTSGWSQPPEYALGLSLWDGETQERIETDDDVQALAVWQGDLIAAGEFTTIGGVAVPGVARFDGQTWTPLGSPLGARVWALEVIQGQLYLGGEFTLAGGGPADYIARWDGMAWTSVGGGTDGVVRSIASYAGDLVIGGEFDTAGGMPATRVARWDGMAWSAVGGAGWDGPVYALAEYMGELVAGGRFGVAGGSISAQRLAAWDGAAWRELGGGLAFTGCTGCESRVYALLVDGTDLVVCGENFNLAGGMATDGGVAIWDGAAWLPTTTGLNIFAEVYGIAPWKGDYAVVGDFTIPDPISDDTSGAALWDRTQLRPILNGLDSFAVDLLELGGDIVAAGNFDWGSGERLGGVGRYDGLRWHGYAGGFDGPVLALAEFGGQLIAGGDFASTATGAPIQGLAQWDGQDWLGLGAGLQGTGVGIRVEALLEYQGALVAGGRLQAIGVPDTGLIARWDGANWSALGDGFVTTGASVPTVRSLAEFQGDLYATGKISRTPGGTTLNHIARWDGVGWAALGAGLSRSGLQLAVWNGQLVVCGTFDMVDGLAAPEGLAFWNGSSWSIPPSSPLDSHRAVAAHQGELITAGYDLAGDLSIQAFDGMSWRDLTGDLRAVEVESFESGATFLHVAGWIYGAGSQPAGGFISYGPDCECLVLCGDCDGSGAGPDILDALRAARIASGILVSDDACCDVDSDGNIGILDSLVMAQVAAGLPVAPMCQ